MTVIVLKKNKFLKRFEYLFFALIQRDFDDTRGMSPADTDILMLDFGQSFKKVARQV